MEVVLIGICCGDVDDLDGLSGFKRIGHRTKKGEDIAYGLLYPCQTTPTQTGATQTLCKPRFNGMQHNMFFERMLSRQIPRLVGSRRLSRLWRVGGGPRPEAALVRAKLLG